MVASEVHDGAVNVARGVLRIAQCQEAAAQPNEGLLQKILRFVLVPGDEIRHAAQPRCVDRVQVTEALIPGSRHDLLMIPLQDGSS